MDFNREIALDFEGVPTDFLHLLDQPTAILKMPLNSLRDGFSNET